MKCYYLNDNNLLADYKYSNVLPVHSINLSRMFRIYYLYKRDIIIPLPFYL